MSTTDLLKACVASARRSAEERERLSAADIAARAGARIPRAGLFQSSLADSGVRIIAECKRRSPSRGVIRREYDPVAIARSYERAGSAAISVLTESSFFDGHLDHLAAVREAVRLPILRKDFISIEFQIVEARAAGADAVLLIVAALDQRSLTHLIGVARQHGLAALVEVHDRSELERALDAGAAIVGVNSRNLSTLEITPGVFDELAPLMPAGIVRVAESGLRTADDIARLRSAGFQAFLIGERFMADPDPGAALASLRATADAGVGGRA